MRSGSESIATYIRAKDRNRPDLMASAFVEDATLEMVVNTGTISFPPLTRGLASITEVLVTRFGQMFDNVRTFCLAGPPRPDEDTFSCAWLVAMSERQTGAVRVGCGRYDWSFRDGSARLVEHLRITVDLMQVLPAQDFDAVMGWLAKLPYPWCPGAAATRNAPRLDGVEPVIRYLERG